MEKIDRRSYEELTQNEKMLTTLVYDEPVKMFHNCGDSVFNYTLPRVIGKKCSDVSFGDVTTDVVCIYCERCLTIIKIKEW